MYAALEGVYFEPGQDLIVAALRFMHWSNSGFFLCEVNMASISFYRKYRPKTFVDVVGQDNIVTILNNAIKQDHISHAYIFNGPRGTGKTSIAKIFARSVSCTCSDFSCDVCVKFSKNQELPDIWEIDAASNNGVDQIRTITENVSYLPMSLKYKVYIIDEVHMLSTSAFNALLKTLEEPPKHVIFILATTEIHKVPLTVLSRCQRFDFGRVDLNSMKSKMEFILTSENIKFENSAIELIAKLSDGGMRDALSLLEKVSVYSDVITLQAVNKSLGLVSDNEKYELLEVLNIGDYKLISDKWQEIILKGIDQAKFINQFQYYIRDLLFGITDFHYKKILIHYLKCLSTLEEKLLYTKNFDLVIEIHLLDMVSVNEINVETPAPAISQMEILQKQKTMLLEQIQVNEKVKTYDVDVEKSVEKPITENNDFNNFIAQAVHEVAPAKVIGSKSKVDLVDDKQEEIGKHVPNLEGPIEGEILSGEVFEEEVETQIDYTGLLENHTSDEKLNVDVAVVELGFDDNISLFEILNGATKVERDILIRKYFDIKLSLEEDQQFGTAKFFELTEVRAASKQGFVITIENDFIKSYSKRLVDISKYIAKKTNIYGKIYLLSEPEWLQVRSDYINHKKMVVDNDIYKLAIETFGSEIVKRK